MNYGTVYWITGLSCAGKTTIGSLLYKELKKIKKNIVFLDGDILRDIFGNDLGYFVEDRKKAAVRNSNLCKALSDQGIDTICATIGMFHDIREWNEKNIKSYKEIYLKVPREILIKRDVRGLYKRALNGEEKNVVGIDIEAEEPVNPDVLILNDETKTPEEIVAYIMQVLITN